jgi:hypothetical protein
MRPRAIGCKRWLGRRTLLSYTLYFHVRVRVLQFRQELVETGELLEQKDLAFRMLEFNEGTCRFDAPHVRRGDDQRAEYADKTKISCLRHLDRMRHSCASIAPPQHRGQPYDDAEPNEPVLLPLSHRLPYHEDTGADHHAWHDYGIQGVQYFRFQPVFLHDSSPPRDDAGQSA